MKDIITLTLLVTAILAQDPHAGIALATVAFVIIALGNRSKPPRNA